MLPHFWTQGQGRLYVESPAAFYAVAFMVGMMYPMVTREYCGPKRVGLLSRTLITGAILSPLGFLDGHPRDFVCFIQFSGFACRYRRGALSHKTKGDEMIRWLMLALVPVFLWTTPSEPAALHDAAKKGDTHRVRELLATGADVNAKTNTGSILFDEETPLHYATFFGHVEAMKVLIEAGADVNAKEKYGKTPLHHAASQGDVKATKLLLEAGADVSAKEKYGSTPLSRAIRFAAMNKREERVEPYRKVIEILQAHGPR